MINSDWLRMWLTGKHFKCELSSFDSIDQDESFLQIALQDMDMLDTLAERVEAWEIDRNSAVISALFAGFLSLELQIMRSRDFMTAEVGVCMRILSWRWK